MRNSVFLAKSIPAAFALMMLTSAAAHADWQRTTTTIGPKGGVWTSEGQGQCQNGICTSNQQYTGPRGNVTTRTGQSSCANGVCEGSATYTGPKGRQWNRSWRAERVR
jgi:hypothetical protein